MLSRLSSSQPDLFSAILFLLTANPSLSHFAIIGGVAFSRPYRGSSSSAFCHLSSVYSEALEPLAMEQSSPQLPVRPTQKEKELGVLG